MNDLSFQRIQACFAPCSSDIASHLCVCVCGYAVPLAACPGRNGLTIDGAVNRTKWGDERYGGRPLRIHACCDPCSSALALASARECLARGSEGSGLRGRNGLRYMVGVPQKRVMNVHAVFH